MHLAAYLADAQIADRDFADRIGVSRQALHRYRQGSRIPRPEVLAKIKKATAGAVTADDFMAEPAPATPGAGA